MQFAEVLRAHKGVESRSAILGTDRVDIIRGKDFARWFRSRADEVSFSASKGEKYEYMYHDSIILRLSILSREGRPFVCRQVSRRPIA